MMNLTTLVHPTYNMGSERGHTISMDMFHHLNYNRWHCIEEDPNMWPKDRAAKLMNLKLVTR